MVRCNTIKNFDKGNKEIVARWLVVLTDGKDTTSKEGDQNTATANFLKEEVNLALITLGEEYEKDVVEQWKDAIKKRIAPNDVSDGFIHVKADPNDTIAIKEAFEQVFEKISEATSGAAG